MATGLRHMSRTQPNIELVRGIPDGLEYVSYFDPSVNNLIVLDDLMTAAKNDNRVGDLFTKGSHHRCLSTIYVVQNQFAQGKASRDVSLNCQYLVLFNSPVDRHQISLCEEAVWKRNYYSQTRHTQRCKSIINYSQPVTHACTCISCTLPTTATGAVTNKLRHFLKKSNEQSSVLEMGDDDR
jgi:hypothetical protein